ncbi:septum formation inhibitor Maf [Seongchinamella sediminis]|uniref:7-methyl-GTP pyrophosphatase n=1 Tax=Seongchinamella sediminis TaxID=2283635 RepID=A0A3L7E036_9GAMM|nr:Maf family nucleotide pyrophosphatase [Seongchinamella sediminis]RLQ23128.1 septum formation inhibitor Maf [Seongchinamella sediminis]
MELILASTSPYRRQLLERLAIPFTCEAPAVDEKPLPGEAPEVLASRLALAKARAIASRFPAALVLGSDQVASIAGDCIGKPGNHQAAAAQLRASAGRRVSFYTGVALVARSRQLELTALVPFAVEFRALAEEEIQSYLQREQPYDCAGSFKCEGLGISLFERMIGDDPTSLEGLPLIATNRLLRQAGLPCP